MSVRLRTLAGLVMTQGDAGVRPYVALEHVESGTGRVALGDSHPWRDRAETGTVVVEPGDVLFGKLRPYLAKTWRVDQPVYASSELLALRPTALTDSRWLGHLMASRLAVEWAAASSDGTKMPRTSWEKLSNFRLNHVPSVAEQRAIADFLDRETARIDALITAKRRMIGLVEEREERSPLNTVGDWRSSATRTLRQYGATVVTGPFGTQLAANEYIDGGIPVINPTHIRRGRLMPEWNITVDPPTASRLARHRLSTGDIVLGRKGDVGRSAVVPSSADGWLCGSDAIAIRTGPHLRPGFLAWCLRLSITRQFLEAGSTGAMMANVNESLLLRLPLISLPTDTQADIESAAERISSWFEAVHASLTKQIELLVEHRQALITAAVTGELDVGVAA